MFRFAVYYVLLLSLLLPACGDGPWNNPYPDSQAKENIYYDTFSERPKHLDPASSYSANEYVFLGQIYEPPLQYHFLKRPYELTTLTATEIPTPEYYDEDGNHLGRDAPAEKVHRAVYRINIEPGIRYQPHPAFAKNKSGEYYYHSLDQPVPADIHTLEDFPEVGTRELTSEDYVYQIKRLVHPKVHSPIAGLMSKYILGLKELTGGLAGADLKGDGYIDLREHPLEGVHVLDRYTFEITLKEKYPQFRYWLSMPFFSPIPWEADRFYSRPGMKNKNISFNWYPIGTGPYMLSENNPNRRMVLVRNPNFNGEPYPTKGEPGDRKEGFLDDAGKIMPFIDKAIFSLEKEAIPAWNKFLQGYYDTSGIVSDSFDQAVQFDVHGDAELTPQMQKKNIQLNTAVTTSTFYMGFNMLDDVVGGDSEQARLLRRAISIAVDYEEYISIFQNSRGVPAQGPIPPGIFGHVEGKAGINPYVYQWVDGQPKRRSIEDARQIMTEAGYPGGRIPETGQPLLLNLDTPSAGPGAKATFDWLVKQFEKIGIKLVIRATDYNRFQEKMLNGTAQIYQWGWNADYPDPENFLFLLYGPNGKATHNGENASNYANDEFDVLFNRMKNMANGPERQAIVDRMVRIARRDAPWLWGFHPVAFSLHHHWYKNAKPNLMSNNTLKYKRIDPVARYEARRKWNKPVVWPLILLAVLFVVSIIPAWITYKRRERSAAL